MLPRNELLLKSVCVLAGAVLLFQAGRAVLRGNPLAKVKIPELPTLTNAPVTAKVGSVTNTAAASTNKPGGTTSTNAPALTATGVLAAIGEPATNRPGRATNAAATTSKKLASTGTNALNAAGSASTNLLAAGTNAGPTTNATMASSPPGRTSPQGMPGAGPGPGGPRAPLPPLPKTMQARLDRIIESELLGPVMRPLPMALLGIAGEHVFLRAPNGQTGLVKEGDSLAGVKLLKVGINRVLVEEDGQKKELTMFNGLGGETLMSNAKTNL